MSSTTWGTGRDALSFCGICGGLMAILFGAMMYFMIGPMVDAIFQMLFLALTFIGVGLVAMGIALVPASRRRAATLRRVLEIAAVEKEVTISEIHDRTGIDSEIVRQILVHCLMNRILFGYIEDDLFVRDTSGRPARYTGQTGLFSG